MANHTFIPKNILKEIRIFLKKNYKIVNFNNIFLIGSSVLYILKNKFNLREMDLDFCFFNNKELESKLIKNHFKQITKFGVFSQENISFVKFRKENKNIILFTDDIVLDAYRRDFSVNTIYISLSDGFIYDPLNGLEDVRNKAINLINSSGFIIDDSRMLRMLKLIFKHDYKMNILTKKILYKTIDFKIKNNSFSNRFNIERTKEFYNNIPTEKIIDEEFKIYISLLLK